MLNTISPQWQQAFLLGWESFRQGSIPIGAVIADENGSIISCGRNRVCENSQPNSKTAHAEVEAINTLDLKRYPDLKRYTLYACMEPCPMCMGTAVMSNLRRLKIAAHDGYCGAVHYCNDDPYIASKDIQAEFEGGLLETVQLVMQTYFELRMQGASNAVVDSFRRSSPVAVAIAERMYEERYLDKCAENGTAFSEIFNTIAESYKKAVD